MSLSTRQRRNSNEREASFRDDVQGGSLSVWRENLVRNILRVLDVVGLLAVAASSLNAIANKIVGFIPFYIGVYGLLLLISLWKRVPYTVRAGTLVFLIYGLAVFGFWEGGLSGDGRVFLLMVPFLVGLLFGSTEGYIALGVSLATLLVFGILFAYGTLTIPVELQANTADPTAWLSGTVVFTVLSVLSVLSLNYILPRFETILAEIRRLAQRLEIRGEVLEVSITERNTELARRSAQLESAAQVAREAATIRDIDLLLDRTVNLISERFGYYHAAIYLLNDAGDYAILRAASSEGGTSLLRQGHRLRVGEEGIVGHVARTGESRLALDVGEDAAFFDVPELSATRSEIALPLRSYERIMGVIDVQSTESGVFSEQDIIVLQTLSDQIALVISNAQLIQQVQESMEAERRAFSQLGRVGWQELMTSLDVEGFVRNTYGTSRTGQVWRPRMAEAVQSGKLTLADKNALAIPIKVRGNVIGVIDACKPEDAGEWSPQQIELLQTLVEQLQLSLENAQLYQDSRIRAAREQLTREITDMMRRATTMDVLIKTTIEELMEVLGTSSTFLQLRPASDWQQPSGDISEWRTVSE
ncbi:MAG: GAF domain-containing protein [Anaerolineae bacterium]|nr:GAF domain-containing protein [Anaerolineae bacterium]